MVVHAISEHVENAGVHSGDATLIQPAQNIDPIHKEKVSCLSGHGECRNCFIIPGDRLESPIKSPVLKVDEREWCVDHQVCFSTASSKDKYASVKAEIC